MIGDLGACPQKNFQTEIESGGTSYFQEFMFSKTVFWKYKQGTRLIRSAVFSQCYCRDKLTSLLKILSAQNHIQSDQ